MQQATYISFQSYQGSIFTWSMRPFRLALFPFNPIKVLFLRWGGGYRGFNHILSILSRFYFYDFLRFPYQVITQPFQSYQGSIFTGKTVYYQFGVYYLSILSRFYFYDNHFQICMPYLFSFNPIKVLFLHDGTGKYRIVYVLSILSRFYFYSHSYKHGSPGIPTFNPIKVLFLPY